MLEPDPAFAGAIECFLTPAFRTSVAQNIDRGEDLFRDDRFVGMMLNVDITRKFQDVLDLLTRLRAGGDERFVVAISAWDADELPTRLYDAGADAFVSMPFRSYREILSLLRRHICISASNAENRTARQRTEDGPFYFAGALITPDLTICFPNGCKARLLPKQAGLLRFLSSKDGCLVKRSEIMAAVWGRGAPRLSASLDVYLSGLRRLFRANGLDIRKFVNSRKGEGWWISHNILSPSGRCASETK